jgi:hypothetical protein
MILTILFWLIVIWLVGAAIGGVALVAAIGPPSPKQLCLDDAD